MGILWDQLDNLIDRYSQRFPPPNPAVFQGEVADLQQIARIFLAHEQEFARLHVPVAQEIAVGLRPESDDATPLDSDEAVVYDLGNGGSIRFRGRIDRLDKINKTGQYVVLDYKTGASSRFYTRPPFNQGRGLQGPVYIAMSNHCLAKSGVDGASVVRFGYFFPGTRAQGDLLDWSDDELVPGREIIANLCNMLAAGCFVASDDKADMRFSDYSAALGSVEGLAKSTRRKMESGDDTLELFARLRR